MERVTLPGPYTGFTVRCFSLARHALLEALRLLGTASGDQVLLPSFICREFLAPIHLAGATALYYDVDAMLRPTGFPEAASPRAVIAVNFFGFPQDLTPFREYCRQSGAVLIEDNAHGFLSRDESGQLLGSRGDIGIFSIRKTYPLPDGAALLVADCRLHEQLRAPLPFCRTPLSRGFLMKRFLRQTQNSTGLPVRTASELLARTVRRIRTGRWLPPSPPEAEQVIPGDAPMHAESYRMLETMDENREVSRRRDLFRHFHRQLAGVGIQPVFDTLPDGTAPYGYVFRADTAQARTVAAIARRQGFDCSSWPDLPDALAATAPDYYRNLWWVNFLC